MFQKLGFSIAFVFITSVSLLGQLSADFDIIYISQCPPGVVNLVNNSEGYSSIQWDFGNGNSSTNDLDTLNQVYPNAGTFDVVLTVSDGSEVKSVTQTVHIFKEPQAVFTTSMTEGCIPMSVTYTEAAIQGDAPIEEYYWDFRNGSIIIDRNPTVSYTQVGEFDLLFRVTDTNGCQSYTEKEALIKTHRQPIANFSYLQLNECEVPSTVKFTNATNTSMTLNYSWDFGSGDTSNTENPEYEYTAVGTYPVMLKASNDMGCADSITKSLRIDTIVESNFDIYDVDGGTIENEDTVCPGTFSLKNTSSVTGLASWYVDGSWVSRLDSCQVLLEETGWHLIYLIPNASANCMDPVRKKIYISGIKAGFSMTEAECRFPLTVNFTDESEGAQSYNWILPQGHTSTEENPEITVESIYTRNDFEGTLPNVYYNCKLTVVNALGCVDSITKVLEFVHPDAALYADGNKGCVPLEIGFSDSTESTISIARREWIFGDGTTSDADTTTTAHSYNTPGDYEAILIIENEQGCTDTSEAYTILAGKQLEPDFSFTPKSLCYADTISFTDLTPESGLADYWSYSSSANIYSECETDPNPSLGISAKQTGYHDVSLEVSYNGCVSKKTYTDAIYVRGPIASFVYDIDCATPKHVQFEGSFDLADAFTWDFDDGTTGNVSALDHDFASTGDYLVKLTSTNDTTGCVHEFEKEVQVREVHAAFESDTIACVGESIVFDASVSTDFIDKCMNEGFMWDFGDSTAPRKTFRQQKRKSFNERGTYNVSLEVKDVNGCVDSVSHTVHVFQPDPAFTVDTSSGCTPELSVTFQNSSTDTSIKSFRWYFGDGGMVNNVDTISHTYNTENETQFNALLVAYDTYECSKQVSTLIHLYKPDASFSVDNPNICLGDTLVFNPAYANGDSSYWQFGIGPFLKQDSSYVFTETGDFSVTHKIFKDYCTDSVTRHDYIDVEQAKIRVVASDTVAMCYPQTIQFKNEGEGSDVASGGWDFDFRGYTSPGYADSVYFSFSLPGVYYPSLHIQTKNGCTATDSIKITVHGPYAEFEISDKHPCKQQTIDFTMTEEKDVAELLWDFGDGVASVEQVASYAYTAIDTFYVSLTISDTNKCTPPAIEDTVFVKMVQSDFSFPNSDTLFCVYEWLAPDNNSQGATQYLWSVDGEEFSTRFEPSNIVFDQTGLHYIQLEAEDSDNCRDTASKTVEVFPLPTVNVTVTDSICEGLEEATLHAETDTAWSVQWQPENSIDQPGSFTTTATPIMTTVFSAVVTDTIGCVQTDSAEVFVFNYPQITRLPAGDTTILLGETVQLSVASDYRSSFTWNGLDHSSSGFSDSMIVTPLSNEIYTVNIADRCFETTDEFVVNIREIYTVVLPDVFTPNGDGINDIIYLKGGGIKELISFRIYNRYGNLVYESADIDEGWDGRSNGKLQSPDTYMYMVEILSYEDQVVNATGTFNLMY